MINILNEIIINFLIAVIKKFYFFSDQFVFFLLMVLGELHKEKVQFDDRSLGILFFNISKHWLEIVQRMYLESFTNPSRNSGTIFQKDDGYLVFDSF